MHCSIRDFAKFASYELNGANGNDTMLKPATAKRLRELSQGAGPLIYPQGMKMKAGGGKDGGEKIGVKKKPAA